MNLRCLFRHDIALLKDTKGIYHIICKRDSCNYFISGSIKN